MSEDENKKQVKAAHDLMDEFLKEIMKSNIDIDPIIMASVMFKTSGILLASHCETFNLNLKDQLSIQFGNLNRLHYEGKL